ncbi:TPA: hypothetical protein DEP58_02255 [Patescibacteria group bacterium]|nr:MAG: hypothetical protein UU98_C0009G0001 [Parcubacteria group bacterium GW2011_GWD2_42_14]HCC05107.1 hypothetical protein [Patescibacteria group bacterium]
MNNSLAFLPFTDTFLVEYTTHNHTGGDAMTNWTKHKIFYSKTYCDYVEQIFIKLLCNEPRLYIHREVIESPLGDGLLVEAVMVSYKNHGAEDSTLVMMTTAPLKSDTVYLVVQESQGVIRKWIPWSNDMLVEISKHVVHFLADFQQKSYWGTAVKGLLLGLFVATLVSYFKYERS